jgi:hypothetical protein
MEMLYGEPLEYYTEGYDEEEKYKEEYAEEGVW